MKKEKAQKVNLQQYGSFFENIDRLAYIPMNNPKGETVTAIGSPLGIKNTVSKGNLSARIMQDGYDVLQFTAPISNGSSGGALFNEKGEVIGITFASFVEGQNLNLAIPIELVDNLYQSKSLSIEPTSFEDIYMENFSTEELVSLINAYAITVNCMGDDVRFIIKLETLMDALEEKTIEDMCKDSYNFVVNQTK